jgi:hypothetical protein
MSDASPEDISNEDEHDDSVIILTADEILKHGLHFIGYTSKRIKKAKGEQTLAASKAILVPALESLLKYGRIYKEQIFLKPLYRLKSETSITFLCPCITSRDTQLNWNERLFLIYP